MKKTTVFILGFLFLLVASVVSAVFEDWPFRIPITIDNQSGGTLTDQWVRIDDFPALDLITGNYMLSDAGDVRLVNPTGTSLDVFAQTLGSDVATWWFQVPSLPQNPSTYYMHIGKSGETRDQALGLTSTDAALVPDDATLDITTRLTMESLDVIFDTISTNESYLLDKPGAYALGIRDGNEVFGKIISDTLSALDKTTNNNDGVITGATLSDRAELGGSADFDGTNDDIDFASPASLDDIFAGGGTVEFWAAVDDDGVTDALIGQSGGGTGWSISRPVTNLIRLTAWFNGGTNGQWDVDTGFTSADGIEHWAFTYDSDAAGNNPIIYRNSTSVAFTETISPTGVYISGAANNVIAGEDGAGGSDLNGILDDLRMWDDIRTAAEILANFDTEILGTETNLQGYWRFNGEEIEASHSPIVIDTEYDFRATYDGVNLRLYVDDALEDTAATAITLFVSLKDVDIGPFSGDVTRTFIGDTGNNIFDDVSPNANVFTNTGGATVRSVASLEQLGAGISLYDADTQAGNGGLDASINDLFDGGGTVEFCLNILITVNNAAPFTKGNPNAGWRTFYSNFSLDWVFEFDNTNGFWQATSIIPASERNQWHCYAFVYDADSVANDPLVYKDGVLWPAIVELITPVGTRVTDAAFTFDITSAIAVFDMYVDEVRYWDDIRTPAEILANWDSELTGAEAGLQLYYNFSTDSALADIRVLDLTYEATTVDETADGVAPATAILTDDAASGQQDVDVPDGTLFKIQQDVTISDDTPDTETNVIASILANTLTMVTNLANTYTTAQNAQVVGDGWEFKGTIDDQSVEANDATYEFVRNMSLLPDTKGPLEIKEFNIGEFPIPTPIGGVQLPLDTTMSAPVSGVNVPLLGPIVAAFSEAMTESGTPLNTTFVFIWLFCGLAIIALIGVYIRSKEPMLALGACGLVLAIGSGLGVYTWFLFIAYLVIAGSAVVVIQKR